MVNWCDLKNLCKYTNLSGYYYGNGLGVNLDQVKAFEWYKKAAECNDNYSQYEIGKCFYEGRGTKRDIVKAIYWLNKAKENGNFNAMND
ncbi:hypothetical protein Glove_410g6 [Diversispora epigaea]|uniref:Uncharacterized protein n=1 Tax=Diversispora epigaea TaxID=1348612 RepID=A0A397GY12_9GLOM|nr:hypothetical protein Glove_410g6 [Diversispora epigaea]